MAHQERLAEGLAALGLEVDNGARGQLLVYLSELQRWARRINLTAIRDLDVGIEKHLLDSLTLLPMLRGDERLLDIGSGAGLPGIPLKIALSGLDLVSVDAAEKKVLFQRHVLRTLGLEARTEHSRVEVLAEDETCAASFDLVTARAFSSLELLVELAAPMLKKGGRILAMKGPDGEDEWQRSHLNEQGWKCLSVKRLTLPFSRSQRTILVLALMA
ncbi:MAG: 16S rRNA (guanine(527)-N(7))-methyltransferase RsmG [Desulfuromonas sp.]|nr:MAG: 16S rRNA (guanine(527)-N(7))-methyltransferase RsmG [Desulfuromonas sp.]